MATYVGTVDGAAPTRLVDGSMRVFVAPGDGHGAYLVGIDAAGVVAQPVDPDALTVTGTAITVVPGGVAVSGSGSGVLVTSAAGARPRTIPTWFDRKGLSLGRAGDAAYADSVALSLDGRKLVVAKADSGAPGQLNDIWARDLVKERADTSTFSGQRQHAGVVSDGSKSPHPRRGGMNLLPTSRRWHRQRDTALRLRPSGVAERLVERRAVVIVTASPRTRPITTCGLCRWPGTAAKRNAVLMARTTAAGAVFPDGRFVATAPTSSAGSTSTCSRFPMRRRQVDGGERRGGTALEPRRQGCSTSPAGRSWRFRRRNPFRTARRRALRKPLFGPAHRDSHRWQVSPDGHTAAHTRWAQQSATLDVVNWRTLLRSGDLDFRRLPSIDGESRPRAVAPFPRHAPTVVRSR